MKKEVILRIYFIPSHMSILQFLFLDSGIDGGGHTVITIISLNSSHYVSLDVQEVIWAKSI